VRVREERQDAPKGTAWPTLLLPVGFRASAGRRPLEAHLPRTVGQQGVEAQPCDVCNLRVARLCRFRCAHAKFVYEPPARFDTAVRAHNYPEPEYLVEVEAPFRVSTSRASGTSPRGTAGACRTCARITRSPCRCSNPPPTTRSAPLIGRRSAGCGSAVSRRLVSR